MSIGEKELSLLDLLVMRLKHKIRLDPNNMKQLMLPCYSMILLYRILNEFKILKFYRNALYLKVLRNSFTTYLLACERNQSLSMHTSLQKVHQGAQFTFELFSIWCVFISCVEYYSKLSRSIFLFITYIN